MDEQRQVETSLMLKQRLIHGLVAGIVFGIVYNICAYFTSIQLEKMSCVFSWECNLPFVPWLIVPYFSTGFFFVFSFFIVSNSKQLLTLTQRIVALVLISGVCYLLFPLYQTFTKPIVTNPCIRWMYLFLEQWDSPYNQAPSLHVSLCIVYWSVIRDSLSIRKWGKYILYTWILVIVISTLLIYQHHMIDIVSALVVSSLVFIIFPKDKNERIAYCYFLFVSFLLFCELYLVSIGYFIGCVFFTWIALICFFVGNAYCNKNPYFYKDRKGRVVCWKKIFFMPYWGVCKMMRIWFCKNKGSHPILVLPNLYCGTWLTKKQFQDFQARVNGGNIVVVDLCAELQENNLVQTQTEYYCFPLLDLANYSKKEMDSIVDSLEKLYENMKENQVLYIHCLMGYSRSIVVTTLLYCKLKNITLAEGLVYMQSKNDNIVITKHFLEIYK